MISQEGKALLGSEVLADTRAETKRRQAAVEAKKTLKQVSKPALKRLGTMAKTANVSSIEHFNRKYVLLSVQGRKSVC